MVLCFKLPAVPVIETVAVPLEAVLAAVRLRVLLEPVGFELKEALTPDGTPEEVRVTAPENPFTGTTVITVWPAAPPFAIVTAPGYAERLKFGTAAFTVRLKLVTAVC